MKVVSAEKAQTRHLFPTDDPAHQESQWCQCKPVRRQTGRTILFIHRPSPAQSGDR